MSPTPLLGVAIDPTQNAGCDLYEECVDVTIDPETTGAEEKQTVSIFEALQEIEPDAVYRIGDVLTEDDLMQLVSEPWAGKTGWLIGLALHLAAGKNYCGLVIPKAVSVLFWQAEGSRKKFKERVRVAAVNYGISLEGLPLKIMKQKIRPADFSSPAFREIVVASGAQVVICDTRRFFAPTAEENSSTDLMKFVIVPLKGIAADCNIAFVVTTHFGHPNEKRAGPRKPRGSSAQEGDFDVLCTLESPNGKREPERLLVWDKIRDEPEREPLPLLFEKDRHVFTVSGTPAPSVAPKESRAEANQASKDEADRKAKDDIAALIRKAGAAGKTFRELQKAFHRGRPWLASVLGGLAADGRIHQGKAVRVNGRKQERLEDVWLWS